VLPFAVEEVEVLRPLPARVFAHVRIVEQRCCNITVLDEDGRECIKLNELTLRQPQREATAKAPITLNDALNAMRKVAPQVAPTVALPEFFFAPVWEPAPLAATELHHDLYAGSNASGPRTVLIIHPPQETGLERALGEAHTADRVITACLSGRT